MRKLLIFAFMLPILSACASSASDPDTASSTEETGYITGSNLPVKKSKMTNVTVLPGEQAAAMRGAGVVQSSPR